MARNGYTLFELVLVMGLVVVVASITIPLAESFLAPNRIISAGDMIRGKLAEMRTRAMNEGRPYRFLILENTGKFRFEPDDDLTRDMSTGEVLEGDLPEPVLFVKEQSVLLQNTPPSPGREFQAVVTLLADGTARDDAQIIFGQMGRQPHTLRIRALTGAVTTHDGSTPEEMP